MGSIPTHGLAARHGLIGPSAGTAQRRFTFCNARAAARFCLNLSGGPGRHIIVTAPEADQVAASAEAD